MKHLLLTATLALLSSASPTLAAQPVSTPAAPPTLQQAHAVRICENGYCWWTREHWGYGGGWRRHDDWRRDRDWGRDWRYDDDRY